MPKNDPEIFFLSSLFLLKIGSVLASEKKNIQSILVIFFHSANSADFSWLYLMRLHISKPFWAAGRSRKRKKREKSTFGALICLLSWEGKNDTLIRRDHNRCMIIEEMWVVGCTEDGKKNDQIDARVQIKPWFCLYRLFRTLNLIPPSWWPQNK